ncbi:MAG: type I DNA topoisomerase [Clostridia bacterium]|nr:type I DNA topoisomerase [Clostridia bacterium]
MANKLVIVESPSKAKTIKKYLGNDYEVIASQGHIIDLPASKIGVDIENDFKPEYKVMKGKAKIVKQIKDEAKNKDKVYLATDPDREGEAIAWHIKNVLNIDDNDECRIEFNEITQNAVKKAVKNPRKVDLNLVDAQQARRILDRIVGYKLSPLLWKKIKKGLSAGRVQSVALKIIMDREKEIRNFIPEEYWVILAKLEKDKEFVIAKFYGDINGKIELKDEKQVKEIVKKIDHKEYRVIDIKNSERRKNPPAPFTTSSLQQEASRKLGFGVKKTMMVAQKLYEAGFITYMRTDSTRLSSDAMAMAKKYIESEFGKNYYSERVFKTKQTAQDAHEAIRPTHVDAYLELDRDEEKLYHLIKNRFLASQMAVAVYDTTKIRIQVEDYIFHVNGSVIKFDGFMKLYIEGKDARAKGKDSENDEEFENNNLPLLKIGDILNQKELKADQKFTEPPVRYTEASLVKVMEEKGIGRPSTYAPTVSTLEERTYIEKENKYLIPTDLGEIVDNLMEENFKDIVDLKFTAEMENKLDMVAENKENYIAMLHEFYTPFIENLENVENKIERVKIPEQISDEKCELCGRNMVIKQGRFGKFLACPGYPECKNTKPIIQTVDVPCPKCGGKILIKKTKTKRNFYVCENNTNNENSKCDFISWNKPKKEK